MADLLVELKKKDEDASSKRNIPIEPMRID